MTMAVYAALLSLLSLSVVSAFSAPKHRTYPYRTETFGSRGIAELVSGDVPWNSLVGEADRAFRLGVQLEKNGQASKASAAFHESTTLYQCLLDFKSEFRHVTSLTEEDCPSILAYASLRLGFLNLDALGDSKAALRLFKEATHIDPFPSAVSYHMVGQSIEASEAGRGLNEAIAAYRQALKLSRSDHRILFHLAVALERIGEENEANELMDTLRRDEAVYACLVDSWGYVRWHTRKIPNEDLNLYRGTRDMLEIALDAAMPLIQEGGLVCEFGVGGGRSFRMIQEVLPLSVSVHGFDSFNGLPIAWGNEPAGTYSTGGVAPTREGRAAFHIGLFKDTLSPFLQETGKDSFLAFANIDCNLYSSTLDVVEAMHGRIVPGTILIFDEYMAHPSWRSDEFRAWRECCKRFGLNYEYLAFSLATKQAVVRIINA